MLRPLLYETNGDEDALTKLVTLLDLPKACVAPLLESLRSAVSPRTVKL